jgi:glycosyltransferase involved in cell wall biosynthesis
MATNESVSVNKPRLLFIVGRFVVGGHASDNIPLLYLLRNKYTIQIIYGRKEPDEMEPEFLLKQYPGLDVQKLPTLKRTINPFADLITLISLYKKVSRFRPDIIHTHGSKSGLAGRLAGWMYGKAVIIHTFHGHLFHSYFSPIVTKAIITVERLMSKITHAAIALGTSQKDDIVEKFKIFPAHKVSIIPLGMVEPDKNFIQRQNLRTFYKVRPEEITIAIVGRIVPIKNHIDFLKIACEILAAGVKNVRFFIIGDGTDRRSLELFLQEKAIAYSVPENILNDSKIIFTSWISDMYSVIDELDIVALTSSNEGTPVSLIEAQLCSKPVVAYNVGGVKDTFVHNESGFLVDKGDIDLFAKKTIELINDKDLRTKMGIRGKGFASEKYSKEKEVAAIELLYTTLLNQSKKVS